ncbi:uncharacterized protein LOC132556078 [Ylistrum balloti]|uniref:uncharacterized protein LOC132556078 n=1 Tax=Ylistrum balloti TaxID=509963 RepID=UPI002905CDB4|nr:uncharacterized protein LOC132556078 [Ylistrum balloti]
MVILEIQKKRCRAGTTRVVGTFDIAVAKEVIMAHSAYARAAGLQSEVNKITVTRVAGNEVEYKRQLNLYRKDMMLTINNIQREEKRLKKSMVRYRGRMRQNRREKKQRDKEDFERDQRAMNNMSNVLVVQSRSEVVAQSDPLKEGSPDSGIGEEIQNGSKEDGAMVDNTLDDENENEDSENAKLKSKRCVKKLKKGEDCNDKTYITLPVINEDTEETEDKSVTGTVIEEDREDMEGTPIENEVQQPQDKREVSVSDSKVLELPDVIKSKRRPAKILKTKKQVVSFADLIKLQHSTSTKKLFDLVHILAEKHGVREDQDALEKENRNIVALRSTGQGISDSMMRAASVLYPMKFGYVSTNDLEVEEPTTPSSIMDDPSTDNSGLSSPLETKHASKPSSPHVNFRITDNQSSGVRNYSRQTEPTLPSVRSSYPKENVKRNNSMPTLLDQVEKVQKANSHKHNDIASSQRRHSLSKSSNSTPRILPPLEKKRLSAGNVYEKKSDAVSWTEAFALLKGVHNLFD